jgi:hypothetical protein
MSALMHSVSPRECQLLARLPPIGALPSNWRFRPEGGIRDRPLSGGALHRLADMIVTSIVYF